MKPETSSKDRKTLLSLRHCYPSADVHKRTLDPSILQILLQPTSTVTVNAGCVCFEAMSEPAIAHTSVWRSHTLARHAFHCRLYTVSCDHIAWPMSNFVFAIKLGKSDRVGAFITSLVTLDTWPLIGRQLFTCNEDFLPFEISELSVFSCSLVDFIMGLISLKTLCLSEHKLRDGCPGLNAFTRLGQHPVLETVHLDAQCQVAWNNCAAVLKIPQLVTLSCKYRVYWHPGFHVSSRAMGVLLAGI